MSILLRDIRASYDTRFFGASFEEGSVTIWKSDDAVQIATVKPGFSGGENRHFIDPVNRLIYSGTWEDGLTCFDYEDKQPVWHRSDLIGIKSVDLSAGFPSSVFVTLEAPDSRLDEPGIVSGVAELNAEDGSTKWMVEEGDWVFVHPCQPLLVIQVRSDHMVRILDGGKSEIGSTRMMHFAVIDVGFSEDMIALAEGAKGVRIIDHKGREISRYVPKGRKPNCIRVSFSDGRLIVFDSWDGSFVTIVEPGSGKVLAEYDRITNSTICFIDDGARFVDSSGRIFRSIDGQAEATLKV